MRLGLLIALACALLSAEDFPHGQIIDPVKCAADQSQTYALYLPSNYSADRPSKLILAFDPRGQGRQGR